jgi:lysozyme family protein
MTHGFTDALGFVLHEEGGYSNNPQDKGGMTNLGVTWRTWQAWSGRPATEQIMRSLRIIDVAPLYRTQYWCKIAGDNLGGALGLAVFDFAVNAGVPRAAKMLQSIVGAKADGAIGPGTLRAVQAYVTSIGLAKLIARFCDARRDYYRFCDDFPTFEKGWIERVDRVEMEALAWVG